MYSNKDRAFLYLSHVIAPRPPNAREASIDTGTTLPSERRVVGGSGPTSQSARACQTHRPCCKNSILNFLPFLNQESVAEVRFCTVDRGQRVRCCAGESSPPGKTLLARAHFGDLLGSNGAKSHDCNGFFIPGLAKSQNRTFAASERNGGLLRQRRCNRRHGTGESRYNLPAGRTSKCTK